MNDGEDLKPTPWSVARNWRFGPNPHDWFPLKGGTSCYIRGYLKMWHPPKTPWVPQFHHRFSHRNHPFIYHLRHIKTAKINRPNSVQIDPTLLRFPIIFRVFLHVRQGHATVTRVTRDSGHLLLEVTDLSLQCQDLPGGAIGLGLAAGQRLEKLEYGQICLNMP